MLKNKIAFIGPGVMAEAMIAGLLRKKLAKPENIVAAGPREERGAELQKKYGIKTTTDNSSAVTHADVVVLSVKPQRLSEVMKGLKGIRSEALIVSIIAGASIKKISTGLKHKSVVRSMPNTPGQIGEGITVWTSSKEVTEAQQEMARGLAAKQQLMIALHIAGSKLQSAQYKVHNIGTGRGTQDPSGTENR